MQRPVVQQADSFPAAPTLSWSEYRRLAALGRVSELTGFLSALHHQKKVSAFFRARARMKEVLGSKG